MLNPNLKNKFHWWCWWWDLLCLRWLSVITHYVLFRSISHRNIIIIYTFQLWASIFCCSCLNIYTTISIKNQDIQDLLITQIIYENLTTYRLKVSPGMIGNCILLSIQISSLLYRVREELGTMRNVSTYVRYIPPQWLVRHSCIL